MSASTLRILIDLDAACNIGEPAGQKMTSSSFFPPELARLELEKSYGGQVVTEVIASEKLEMWYFGLLLLQMSTKDAPTLWQSTQADNILHSSDMYQLAYAWDTMKLDCLGQRLKEISEDVQPAFAQAMDLALWCLQGVADRRPCSFEAVVSHKLFHSAGELRFLQLTEDWDSFVRRQAAALHAAIDNKDSRTVEELFSHGGVHINMIDTSVVQASTVRPLHRAAFTGDPRVMHVLLDQIEDAWPGRIKSEILDTRSTRNNLFLTPYMLACTCGHTEVAQMLAEKGCDQNLMNSARKTGKKILDAFKREVLWSHVHPWNRGDRMHLAAKDAESFLDMTKAGLNEHVHAGMQVWNSKLMVWKLNKEQMQALQAEIKQLVLACTAHTACTGRTASCTRTHAHSLARMHARTRLRATCTEGRCTHARTRTGAKGL